MITRFLCNAFIELTLFNNAVATTIDGTPLASNAFDAKCKQYFEDIDQRFRDTGGFMQILNSDLII